MRMSKVTNERPVGNLWVPPDRVRSGGEQDTLITGGIGPCIELAVHDDARKIGHMAHIYSTRGSQQTTFSELQAALELHGTDPKQASAWVIGGSSEASMSGYPALRMQAIERLAELGFHPGTNLSVEWNDDEGVIMTAALDCASGTHTVSPRQLA